MRTMDGIKYEKDVPIPESSGRRTFVSAVLQLKGGFSVWLPCSPNAGAWLISCCVRDGATAEQYVARAEVKDGVKGLRVWRRTKEQTEAYIAARNAAELQPDKSDT